MAILAFMAILAMAFPAGVQESHPAGTPTAMHQPTSTVTTTSYTLPPDKLEKSKALYTTWVSLRIISSIYSFFILLAVLFFGIAARYRDWAESVSRWRFVQAMVFVALLMITIIVLELPLRAYGHHVSLDYGLSIEGWGAWFVDLLKGEALMIGFAVIIVWLLTTIIRKSPTRWWFYSWLIAVPLLGFVVFVLPLVVDPMFNKFKPLEKTQPQLADAIEKVVQRGGLTIPKSRIYEMDASRRYTTLNAYVTGFGASKRVVIWDTTIQKLPAPETLLVFGHEMGHYVLHHVIYGMIAAAAGLLVGLYLVYRISGWILKLFRQRSGIRELSDWAAVPMIFLVFGVLSFFAEPVGNTFSRHIEHQADIYGLEITHGINPSSEEVAAHTFQALGELSLDYPYPSKGVVLWYYDHPAIADRLRFARDYDPWGKGQTPKYVK
ncbi:MAG TPA: M48 family metallopeptidase [Candidatus Angelobacter sp.]|nr:M48 family metallopeptidase [Candidatus Angelobacter sp.]